MFPAMFARVAVGFRSGLTICQRPLAFYRSKWPVIRTSVAYPDRTDCWLRCASSRPGLSIDARPDAAGPMT